MPLQRNLEPGELALLEIIEDEVWLGEFLRSTRDGSLKKEEWPSRPFEYRWYQKDLLTDKNEFIALVAGRAVGKCNPVNTRVYTVEYGYRSIRDLTQIQSKLDASFLLWSLDPERLVLVQRRARISPNGVKDVYRVKTVDGHVFECTDNHPILTPVGYVMLKDLSPGDEIAALTHLPHASQREGYSWEELRWFGYSIGRDTSRVEQPYELRFQSQIAEMQRIAKYFNANFRMKNNEVRLLRKRGPRAHYGRILMNDTGAGYAVTRGTLYRLPVALKQEKLEHLKIMLEAFLSLRLQVTPTTAHFDLTGKKLCQDLQELLLRFGIESRLEEIGPERYGSSDGLCRVTILDENSYYVLFTTFDIPGMTVKNLNPPLEPEKVLPFMRYVGVESIEFKAKEPTFAITVHGTENFIADNLLVHNSLVLEDKIIHEAVNADKEFPATKEETLVTANVAQMTPILDRLIMRFTASPVLKDFMGDKVNRSKGTMDFSTASGVNFRVNARIAGSRGENNMVGLHVPRIRGDEMQLFPMGAFIQLRPTYNSWEPKRQQFYCGVPNGVREGNVLYFIDQRSSLFKKYRIPATENPYWRQQDHIDAIKQYGGEESDDFQHLVLGQHGNAAFTIIPRDKIKFESYEFFSYRYSQTDKHNGRNYQELLKLNPIPHKTELLILAVDAGYADPTLAQVIGKDDQGVWRTYARYRLTRIPFPEQAEVIDYLHSYFKFDVISVDLGAGGGGIGIMQDLQSPRFGKKFLKNIVGVRFNDYLDTGTDPSGNSLKTMAKSFAGQELSRMITEGLMRFSELDIEGTSQLERVAYQRGADGLNRYFVISERGSGKSEDDHIFASYLVFIIMLLTTALRRNRTKLFTARWI